MYYVAGFLDAGFFVFFPALATLALRKAQGRPVFARIKGRRTLVIADVPMVHQARERPRLREGARMLRACANLTSAQSKLAAAPPSMRRAASTVT